METLLGFPAVLDNEMPSGEVRFGKRRGRPPLSAYPSERIDVRVPRPLYDALCRAALQKDTSLPDVVRQALDRFLSVKNRQA